MDAWCTSAGAGAAAGPGPGTSASTSAEAHYDAAALVPTGERSALQRFHNEAKRQLLKEFAWQAGRLLDLACGRGGDLHKWRALQIAHVTGVDVSENSLAEARARAAKAGGRTDVAFERADLAAGYAPGGEPYDAVSCFFALHYFFGSEAAAHAVVSAAARALRVGGVFFGIVARGRSVVERLRWSHEIDDGFLALSGKWAGPPQCFGSGYTCALRGTVTEASHALEYLVFANVLQKVARAHGLAPVPITSPAFEPEGPHLLRPPYAGAEGLASRLYAGFAFKRVR